MRGGVGIGLQGRLLAHTLVDQQAGKGGKPGLFELKDSVVLLLIFAELELLSWKTQER